MTQVQNFTWAQGVDLTIDLRYKEGPTTATAVTLDLSTGYSLRMDLVVPATKERVYTFNSDTIADIDPVAAGDQPDSTLEATFGNGASNAPNIHVVIPRTLTLPGGAIYNKFIQTPSVATFNYDMFLRNTSTNKQAKILKGTITIEASHTLWQ